MGSGIIPGRVETQTKAKAGPPLLEGKAERRRMVFRAIRIHLDRTHAGYDAVTLYFMCSAD